MAKWCGWECSPTVWPQDWWIWRCCHSTEWRRNHWFDCPPTNGVGWILLMSTTFLTVNQYLSCQTFFFNAQAINSPILWVSSGREDIAGRRRGKKSCTILHHPRSPQLEESPFITNSFWDGCFPLHNPLWQPVGTTAHTKGMVSCRNRLGSGCPPCSSPTQSTAPSCHPCASQVLAQSWKRCSECW